MSEPKIGLVTVLYNSPEVIDEFFQSIAKQTYSNYHIYIYDNSPNDLSFNATLAAATAFGLLAKVTLVKNPDNYGVARANNQGIQASLADECDYVLILNNDIVFKQIDLFSGMVSFAEQQQEKLLIPKMYFHDTGKIWCAGGEISVYRGITSHYGEGKVDAGQYDIAKPVNYAPTCFMLVHQSVFATIGLMDEKYFVYFDDTDFIWRCNQAGFRIFYLPQYKLWHKVSSSTGGDDSLFSIYYGTRNRIYFIRKNFSHLYKIIAMTYTVVTRGIKWLRFSKEQRTQLSKALTAGFHM